jgi:hypothetical protein
MYSRDDINNQNDNRVMSKRMVLTLMAGLMAFSLAGVYAASIPYGAHHGHERFEGRIITVGNYVVNDVPVVCADVIMTDGIARITLGSQDHIKRLGLRGGDYVSLSGFRAYNGTFIPETLHMRGQMLPLEGYEHMYGVSCGHHQPWE